MTPIPLPRHVGVIMDGNRRWARSQRLLRASAGHKAGAEHLSSLLGWLRARGIEHASSYVLSADNVRKRDADEVRYLFQLIETTIPHRIRSALDWQLHVSGDVSLLPKRTREALLHAEADTCDRPCHLTLAIGYDPHAEILSAVRRAFSQLSTDTLHMLSIDSIAQNLVGGPVKDIDLIIRTGGDTRTSGFFP